MIIHFPLLRSSILPTDLSAQRSRVKVGFVLGIRLILHPLSQICDKTGCFESCLAFKNYCIMYIDKIVVPKHHNVIEKLVFPFHCAGCSIWQV